MPSDVDVLFERVGTLHSADPVWRSTAAEARELLASGRVSPARSLALCSLVVSRCATADFAAAESGARDALTFARADHDAPAACLALRALVACTRATGRYESALSFARQLQAIGDANALADVIELLESTDAADAARVLLAQTHDLSDGGHSGPSDSRLAVAALRHLYAFGSLDDAHEAAQRMLRAPDAGDDGDVRAIEARVLLGRIAQLRGNYALARQHVTAAARERGNDEWPALATLTRAAIMVAEGDRAGALAAVREVVLATRASGRIACWLPSWLVEATRLAVDAGDAQTARELVAFARAAHEGTPGSMTSAAVAAQTAGLLAQDLGLLNEAVALARQSPRPLLVADALGDYGRALLAQGRQLEAVTSLDAAWDAYAAVGARGSAVLVQRQLTAVGVRRRKWSAAANRPLEGWGALTEAERRVARLIGAGHTSRSAAAQLGSAPNTVRTQVRSVFGKLGISSRVQLARMIVNEA